MNDELRLRIKANVMKVLDENPVMKEKLEVTLQERFEGDPAPTVDIKIRENCGVAQEEVADFGELIGKAIEEARNQTHDQVKLCDWLTKEADEIDKALRDVAYGYRTSEGLLSSLLESYVILLRTLAQHPSIKFMPPEAAPVATGE